MTDINLKTLTPDTSLPTTGFLFGADSQASTNPSVYSTQTVATTLLGSTSLTGDVLTTSAPVLNLTQQWNSVGTTFTGLKFNVDTTTYNQSAAASLLMDLQVGTVSQFKVDKFGSITTPGTSNSTFNGNTFFGSPSYIRIVTTGSPNQIILGGTSQLTWGTGGFSTDIFLTRKGAANLQLGAADAASPVAQTLSVQSIVGGVSTDASAAAYPFTITGAQGTGTGTGGSIVFKVAPAAGSSSNAQNTLATALTIGGDRNATFAAYASAQRITVSSDFLIVPSYTTPSSGGIAFSAGAYLGSGALDQISIQANGTSNIVRLAVDANNTLALRNSTAAQEFRVYETTTGSIYKAILGNRQLMKISGASFTDGAGASAGTLTNSPAVGNPTKWIPIDDNGTTRYIPAW